MRQITTFQCIKKYVFIKNNGLVNEKIQIDLHDYYDNEKKYLDSQEINFPEIYLT